MNAMACVLWGNKKSGNRDAFSCRAMIHHVFMSLNIPKSYRKVYFLTFFVSVFRLGHQRLKALCGVLLIPDDLVRCCFWIDCLQLL